MKKSPKIIILITVLVVTLTIGLGAVSFAKWAGGNTTATAEGSTGSISFVGVVEDVENSQMIGEGGRFLPYGMPGAELPDRNMLKLVFNNDPDSTSAVHHYEISSVHEDGHSYITLYYWNKSGAPNKPVSAANIGADKFWTEITTTAATLTVAGLTTADDTSKTVYIAYETSSLDDMKKDYQLTIVAVEPPPAP